LLVAAAHATTHVPAIAVLLLLLLLLLLTGFRGSL